MLSIKTQSRIKDIGKLKVKRWGGEESMWKSSVATSISNQVDFKTKSSIFWVKNRVKGHLLIIKKQIFTSPGRYNNYKYVL